MFEASAPVTWRKVLRRGLSCCSGVLVGSAWVWFVDANIFESSKQLQPPFQWFFYFPLAIATLALVMTNVVDLNLLDPNAWLYGDEGVSARVRVWLFFSFFATFCGVAGAIWIGAERFFRPNHDPQTKNVGAAIITSAVMVLLASLLFVFAKSRTTTDEDEESAAFI